jgi:hypothetical protein
VVATDGRVYIRTNLVRMKNYKSQMNSLVSASRSWNWNSQTRIQSRKNFFKEFRAACSHCLFPVVDKSGISRHLATRLKRPLNRLATSCSNKSRNKLFTSWWQQVIAATCYEQPVLASLLLVRRQARMKRGWECVKVGSHTTLVSSSSFFPNLYQPLSTL